MIDFLYVAGTMLFFGLMLLYVVACDALGRRDAADTPATDRGEP
jgi:hypothetical protein